MDNPIAWLSTTFFYLLGAYVGVVSALILGGANLFWTVASGAVKTPFVLFDVVSSIYASEAPLGGRAAPQTRRKKKLAAPPPEVAGAPAGAPMYGYGAGERGLLG